MDFSIIFPSRERVSLLATMIDSIGNQSADLSNVEVLVGIDDDDKATHEAKPQLETTYPFCKLYSRSRSRMLNQDYINWLASMSKGKYLIICNDDARFATKNWDKIAVAKLDEYLKDKPDGIVYGYISDLLIDRHGMGYCCFPLVSSAAYKILGWAMPGEYPSWNADIVCWEVYRAIGRLLDLSEITIEHISYHTGKRARDHISHNVEYISRAGPTWRIDLSIHINKLNEAIRNSK